VKPVNNKTTLKRLLAPIASLRLTVLLLALSMVVILAGTTAQEYMGIWQVQEKYFHSFFCWIDLDLLVPLVATKIPGSIPMLGGYSLIILLLANLLTAHALRFKVSPWDVVLLPMLGFMLAILWAWQNNNATWLLVLACAVATAFVVGVFLVHKKRGGVILIHLGLILLLGGEISTSLLAVESRMTIDEGSYADYSYDIREPELAIIDAASPHQDKVVAIDADELGEGNTVANAALPGGVTLKVEKWFQNSDIISAGNAEAAKDLPAVAAAPTMNGSPVLAKSIPRFTGAGDDASKTDMPAAYVTLSKGGQTMGTYVVSTWLPRPQQVEIDGKKYDLSLRFRRYYLPYRIELQDFRFDRYEGTNTPKNYAAHVRLVDPARGEDREVVISMNDPLRYSGLTYYQASFDDKTERTTVLQVVRNPGVLVPYVSCAVGTVGLTAHFMIVLVNFLGKLLTGPAPGTVGAMSRGKQKKGAPATAGTTYTLQPTRGWSV
jgi:hypothetical protein